MKRNYASTTMLVFLLLVTIQYPSVDALGLDQKDILNSDRASTSPSIGLNYVSPIGICGSTTWSTNYVHPNLDTRDPIVLRTSTGHFLIAGNSNYFVPPQIGNTADLWVILVDATGIVIWDNVYSLLDPSFPQGEETWIIERIQSIEETNDGGFLFSGRYVGALPQYLSNGFLLKINSLGDVEWTESVALETSSSIARYVSIQDVYGDYYSVGTNQSGQLFMLSHTAISRNIAWQYLFEGFTVTGDIHLSLSDQNSIYVTTSVILDGDDTNNQILVGSLTTRSHFNWVKIYDVPGDDNVADMIITRNGDIIIVGNHEEIGITSDYAYVMRLNSQGEKMWERQIQDPTFKIRNSAVIEDQASDLVISGVYSPFIPGSEEAYVMYKLDENGDFIISNVYAGNIRDNAEGLVEGMQGGYLIVGESDSFNQIDHDSMWVNYVDTNGFIDTTSNPPFETNALTFDSTIVDNLQTTNRIVSRVDFNPLDTTVTVEVGFDQSSIDRLVIGNPQELNWHGIFEQDNVFQSGRSGVEIENGRYIIAGLETDTFSDGLLVEIDAMSNVISTQYYGGNNDDNPRQIIKAMNGDIIYTGTSRSSTTDNNDVYVSRLQRDGTVIWTKYFDVNEYVDFGSSIVETANEDLFVVGAVDLEMGFGSDTQRDLLVLKIDKNGDLMFGQTIGGVGDEFAFDVMVDSQDNIVIGGYTTTYGSSSLNSWVLKMNTIGDILWQKVYSSRYAYSVDITNNGNYLIGGFQPSANISRDLGVILELDPQGVIVRQKTFDIFKDLQITSISATNDGGMYVTGSIFDVAWAAKLDDEMNIIWQKEYPHVPISNRKLSLLDGFETSDRGYLAIGNIDDTVRSMIVLKTCRDGSLSYESGETTKAIPSVLRPNLEIVQFSSDTTASIATPTINTPEQDVTLFEVGPFMLAILVLMITKSVKRKSKAHNPK